jgi:cytochrome P450
LPPGRLGPPVLGETLALLRNPYGFLEKRHRRHGDVFRSLVLGRTVAFLSGIDGAQAFYDPENVTRSDAHPFTLVDLFGGINMEMYDGDRHLALKSMALEAFDRDAIGSYLPQMQELIESTLVRLAGVDEFRATAELRTLAIEAIAHNVLGLAPGRETAAVTRDYADVLAGLVALPIPLPGTTYRRARQARDRVLERFRAVIAERRARPGSDGLSRILTARTADGRSYRDDEALLEAHHIVIAGFIVYAHMAEVMRRLAERPDLRDACSAEIRAHAGEGPLTMESLDPLSASTNVVLETKRIVPVVPLAFGRARRTFRCAGYRIPEGWRVYLALHLNNRDPRIFARPDVFDPERFAPDRAEHRRHPMGFIPQGAEPPTGHRCLGLDYSTTLVLTFLALLVRGYEWELPPQDLRPDWRKAPPDPRDGLRVRLHARP